MRARKQPYRKWANYLRRIAHLMLIHVVVVKILDAEHDLVLLRGDLDDVGRTGDCILRIGSI